MRERSAITGTAASAFLLLGVTAGVAAQTNTGTPTPRTSEEERQRNNPPRTPPGVRPGAIPMGSRPGAVPMFSQPGALPMYAQPGAIPMGVPQNGQQPVLSGAGWSFTPYNNQNGQNCPPQTGYYQPPYGYTTVIINTAAPQVPGSMMPTIRPSMTVTSTATPGYTVVESGSSAYGGGYVRSSTTSTQYTTSVTVFPGYSGVYQAGQTVVSPYGSLYGCQPYIQNQFVQTNPYPWIGGREAGSVRVWEEGDRYVADDPARGRSLRTALNDLTRYWENEDVRGLRRRLSPDLTVAVFQGERFAYSLKSRDFTALSADALDRVQTVAFRFNDVKERNDGLVNAYATHHYRLRGDDAVKVATVRCTLVYVDGEWFLSAVSFSPGSLQR